VGILSDIAGIAFPKVVRDINAQQAPTGNVFDIFTGGIWDWVGRQTTTAEERVTPGGIFGPQAGDIPKVLGNIGRELGVLDTIATGLGVPPAFVQPVVSTVSNLATRAFSGAPNMAVNIAPCPTPARSNVGAGQCVTIGDWTNAGAPRGFEVAGFSQPGNTLILRKKGRRRSRRPLPPSLVAQFAQLKDQLGPAMAKTIINRMRF